MKTVEYCICDCCQKPIINEFDGLIIHGAVYTADPKKNGVLIRSCFEPDKNGMVEYNKIAETVLCMNCFRLALEIKNVEGCWPPNESKIFHANREC